MSGALAVAVVDGDGARGGARDRASACSPARPRTRAIFTWAGLATRHALADRARLRLRLGGGARRVPRRHPLPQRPPLHARARSTASTHARLATVDNPLSADGALVGTASSSPASRARRAQAVADGRPLRRPAHGAPRRPTAPPLTPPHAGATVRPRGRSNRDSVGHRRRARPPRAPAGGRTRPGDRDGRASAALPPHAR